MYSRSARKLRSATYNLYMRNFTRVCIYSSLYFFIGSSAALAQKKMAQLYILSENSGVPISSAFAENAAHRYSGLTDQKGFINIPAYVPSITISSIGFKSKDIQLDTVLASPYAIIYLENKIASLAEIRLSSSSNNVFKSVSDLDIHLRPANNSQEILRMVPGLFIGQHGGGGKAEQIFLRGFDIDHGTDINLSVDGMPVNMVSHAHGQGYADLHFVIPEIIDKVNFNKGPYFADKGNFTTAGFVDYKTKNYLDKNFIKTEAGLYNSYRAVVGMNLIKRKPGVTNQSLYVAGESFFADGFFESPQDFHRLNGTLKYHGILSSRSSFTTTLTAFKSKWRASGQIPDRAVSDGSIGYFGAIDNTEGGRTSRYNANVEVITSLANGGLIRNQIFFSKYDFELYSNFTFFKEDPINGDQIRQKEDRQILGYNGFFQRDYFLGKIKSQMKAGVQVRYDIINDVELSRTKNRVENLRRVNFGDVHEMNNGMYTSQRFSISKQIDLTAAVRADYLASKYDNALTNSRSQADALIISPKAQIDFRPKDKVHLYLYTGRGFHSNDSRVVVQQPGRKSAPPAYGADLGGIFKVGKKLVLQSALWYLWLDQEFIYVGDEGIVEPGGKTERYGVDLTARLEVCNNLFADVDVSIANPRALHVQREESFLPLAPRFTSSGGLTYKKMQGFNGSVRYRFMGKRPANEDYSTVAKGYFVSDAAIFFTKRKWEAGLTIQNLFNVRWKETQFETDSRLKNEPSSISEIHFTPGTPFFAKASFTVFF